MEKIIQVEDNYTLLKEMCDAQNDADTLYLPGIYWERYASIFIAELKMRGLKDFRRRKNCVLGSFGATDLNIFTISNYPQIIRTLQKMRFIWRFCPVIVEKIEKVLSPIRKIYEQQFSSLNVIDYFY